MSRKTNGAPALTEATDGAPPDAELMEGLARGRADLLGDLYRRHNRLVFRFVCRMLLDVPIEQAEDLCQEVFMAVLDAAPRYCEEGKFTSWLLGITMRQVRTWQRTQANRQQLIRERGADGMMLTAAEPEGPEDAVERRETIQQALSNLTRDQREVLMLRAAEGRSGEEIARYLGISETAVWSRLKRAHKTARDSVNPPPPRDGTRRG